MTDIHTPKVSVLTPIYNTNPAHLREMIESVLNQTFTDFEFLILNDSPENTEIENIVLEYAARDNRIKYLKNESNLGISASRNKLLKIARGDYLAIFDHDDISLPKRFATQVEYLDRHPEVGVVSGWLLFFGTKNFVHKTPESDIEIKIFLSDNNAMAHTAAMIRTCVLRDNNIEYESFYSPAEDYRILARLMDITCFHNIQSVLVKYRTHGANTSGQRTDDMQLKHWHIKQQICNSHPFIKNEFDKKYNRGTRYRLRLFGIIPLIKVKNNWLYLFEIVPVLRIKWS